MGIIIIIITLTHYRPTTEHGSPPTMRRDRSPLRWSSADWWTHLFEQLRNNKAPGDDGITAELLRAGVNPILNKLKHMFNTIIKTGITPNAWSRDVTALFFKKEEQSLLKNYRPTSLLSHVYKLFSRVITNRFARSLDEFQPTEQAFERASVPWTTYIPCGK
ncbi:jg15657 [Pararge aegeria aegeria]|uniref:Jg15657 protein n=1 Tax=Pararge aegeria aegeria TaxID=348720 RepID=A0A8S4S0N4_9NEOP|nr:jg15657 [Pararge aegeria aegeria]